MELIMCCITNKHPSLLLLDEDAYFPCYGLLPLLSFLCCDSTHLCSALFCHMSSNHLNYCYRITAFHLGLYYSPLLFGCVFFDHDLHLLHYSNFGDSYQIYHHHHVLLIVSPFLFQNLSRTPVPALQNLFLN